MTLTPRQLRAFATASPQRFAAALARAVNEISRRTPAPRALPFFGLEHPEGCGTRLLDRLSELGIFRFYEHVIDLGSGLGGPARWLARRRGCRVVSLAGDPASAAANRLLVRRAHLETAVAVIVAAGDRLPVVDGGFTHAWAVEGLASRGDSREFCREVFRALRPGGLVALHDWLEAKEADALAAGLASAGFLEVITRDVGDLREDETAVAEIVRKRVSELAGDSTAAERGTAARVEAALDARAEAAAHGGLRLLHVVARKPA